MVKRLFVNMLTYVGEKAARDAVCSAPPAGWYQPKEPEKAREKFLGAEK